MKTGTITLRIPPEDIVALNRATNDVKKLAATAPRSFVRAVRFGMRLQRAIDSVKARVA